MQMPNNKEIQDATEIQDQTYRAIENAIEELAILHKNKFPDSSSLLPSLYMASMCLYINSMITSFPAECRAPLIMLVCKSLGFEDISVDIEDEETENDPNDLATMEVAGHA